ncbi:transcriptional regulator [Mycobacteroides chelonae]|uniref:Transcriptional regulator n=2 Tax=Mycobacteroides chelonae TaxID=1774 RepID=A0A1S1LH14_MYCCH|nr:transcriptional regulator [Mycobacteroides chelonae]
MRATRTSQTELARTSGIRQPSISQYLAGKTDFSDEQLDRLLSCMGYELEVTRRPVPAALTRAEHRSWLLHKRLSASLSQATLTQWNAQIRDNLIRLRTQIQGQPHERNLHAWEQLVAQQDLAGLHRVFTGLNRTAIEMREVSPMAGLLAEHERLAALQETR